MTKPSKFWLYAGIILVCSGIGVAFGAILVALYFWEDIKKTIHESSAQKLSPDHFKNSDSPKYYDEDTVEKMK